MPDFKLLFQVIKNHLPIILSMTIIGIAFLSVFGIVFWFSDDFSSKIIGCVFAVFGLAILYLAVVTNHSSCLYYYEKALLKKYGVKASAVLTGKNDDSDYEKEELLFRLSYVYDWKGRAYEGEEFVENQWIFEMLEVGCEIPIIVLSNKPSSSTLQTGRLKWLYQVRNKKDDFAASHEDEKSSMEV